MKVLVTGGNKGIGYEICRGLAKQGVQVIMTARNPDLGIEAKEKLRQENLEVDFLQLDITDNASIDRAVGEIKSKYGDLDTLCNNAGIAWKGDAFNEEVARGTIGTNYFATKNVTEKFLPVIKDGGHVVNLGSRSGRLTRMSPELQSQFVSDDLSLDQLDGLMNQFIGSVADGTYEAKGWPRQTYGVSKAGEIGLTRVLARDPRFTSRGIAVNVMCPGWCRTDMAGDRAPRTAEEGADTAIWLCLMANDASRPNGKFLAERHELDWQANWS
eukprot:Clim_evm2s25 gene=Clim_evmTU2s25